MYLYQNMRAFIFCRYCPPIVFCPQIWKTKKSSKIEGNTLGILRRSFFPFNALGMPSFYYSLEMNQHSYEISEDAQRRLMGQKLVMLSIFFCIKLPFFFKFQLFISQSFTNSSEVENPAIFHSWGENRVWMVCEDSYEVGFPFSQYVFEFKE